MAVREGVTEFILDASVVAVWLFDDESHPIADAVLAELRSNNVRFIPRHWHLEVRNTLLMGARRGRIRSEDIGRRLLFFRELPLNTDTEPDLDVALYLANLARLRGLTMYDAMYLELAIRRRMPLATLDRRLGWAAGVRGGGGCAILTNSRPTPSGRGSEDEALRVTIAHAGTTD